MTRVRSRAARLGLLLAAWLLSACSSDPKVALRDSPLCAFDCPAHGLQDGNAAISGVATADAFFASVIDFDTAAEHQSAALDAELRQLHADFEVADTRALGAEIKRLGQTLLAAGPEIVAGQALCWVDSQRLIDMQTLCDPDLVSTGAIECRGPCRVEPTADCGRLAKLECTHDSPGTTCDDLCSGVCRDAPDQAGKCAGACLGICTGTCDRYAKDSNGALQCAGNCSGTCAGQCDAPVARATCRGSCFGQCTAVSPMDCAAPIEARCQPMPGQRYQCIGACAGVFDAPRGKAECRAAAKAQASLLARCDAPWVSVHRALAETKPSADQQHYLNALHNLELRLPELLADVARAQLTKSAGEALATVATGDVKQSLRTQSTDTMSSVQVQRGLLCAVAEVDRVSKALSPAQRRLATSLAAATELLGAFGLK